MSSTSGTSVNAGSSAYGAAPVQYANTTSGFLSATMVVIVGARPGARNMECVVGLAVGNATAARIAFRIRGTFAAVMLVVTLRKSLICDASSGSWMSETRSTCAQR